MKFTSQSKFCICLHKVKINWLVLISHKICLSRIMGVLPFCNHVLPSWNNKELIVLLLPLWHILFYFIVDIHIRNEVRNWGKSICICVQLKRPLCSNHLTLFYVKFYVSVVSFTPAVLFPHSGDPFALPAWKRCTFYI